MTDIIRTTPLPPPLTTEPAAILLAHDPVALARTWIGTPFRHQGRTRHGIDCVGLLVEVFRACGRDVQDLEAYARDPAHGLLEEMLQRNGCTPVAREDWRAGDIAVIAFAQRPNDGGFLESVNRHAALITNFSDYYLGGGLGLLHTHAGLGRVTEHRMDPRWERRIPVVVRP